MPFLPFILYTAAGSLIWNCVLIGLGVAAGEFVQNNLRYFDYAVAVGFVIAIGWMVYRRVTKKYRGDARRYGPGEEATLTPEDDADRPKA
jgi:membrane protein DedA with SNARE-associated domain